MTDFDKPLPDFDMTTMPFWEGAKKGTLLGPRCANCGMLSWPPAGFCSLCYSTDVAWEDIGRTGVVRSFVVVIDPAIAGPFANDVPYVVAKIAIDDTSDRVLLTSTIVKCDWQKVAVGMRVVIEFDNVTPDITLPRFRPTSLP